MTNPSSLVFTQKDYDQFIQRKKYLSAKLLTYFAEHPLLFIGYSATDSNIAAILSDIDEIISSGEEVIDNIYLLEWKEAIDASSFEKLNTTITIDNGKTVRVNCIVANDFSWVYEIFASNNDGMLVDTKILRKLVSKTYKLVRHDLARPSHNIDYQAISKHLESDEGIATLFGISTIDQPENLAAHYPYIATQLAKKLNLATWHKVIKLIEKIEEITGKKIRESDNPYHIRIQTGNSSSTRKYSDRMLILLKKYIDSGTVNIDDI